MYRKWILQNNPGSFDLVEWVLFDTHVMNKKFGIKGKECYLKNDSTLFTVHKL